MEPGHWNRTAFDRRLAEAGEVHLGDATAVVPVHEFGDVSL